LACEQGVRRRRRGLARSERHEIVAAAISAHTDFQPARRANENRGAEIEQRREQAIGLPAD
jgi:hypothetical protein